MLSKVKVKLKYQMQTLKMRYAKKFTSKSVEIVSKERCSGCGGCKNICPVNAIEMKEDSYGYLLPKVNKEKCIQCGICTKRCPVIDKKKEMMETPKVYAVWAEDEVRKLSSSGGMFTLLAEYVLEQKGVVFGAAFTKDWEVEHKFIEKKEELKELRGAKYVQSDTRYVYREVKKFLSEGRKVLFSGCPCQIAALKSFLGKEEENLLTADLVCHGVPSRMVYRKYLEEVYGKENIESFAFRTKEKGYSCTVLEVKMKDGRVLYPSLKEKDPYEKAFHGSYALRKSCENCKFAEFPRHGDFTIGDFWGVSLYDEKLSDGKGTSVVLVNTTKAEEVLKELEKKAKMVTETPLDAATKRNRFGSHVPVPKTRTEFLENVKTQGFLKAIEKYKE